MLKRCTYSESVLLPKDINFDTYRDRTRVAVHAESPAELTKVLCDLRESVQKAIDRVARES